MLEPLIIEVVDLLRQLLEVDCDVHLLVLGLNLHKIHALFDAVADVARLKVSHEDSVCEEIQIAQVTRVVLQVLCCTVNQAQHFDILAVKRAVFKARSELGSELKNALDRVQHLVTHGLRVDPHLRVVRIDVLIEEQLGDVSNDDELAEPVIEVHALTLDQYDSVFI